MTRLTSEDITNIPQTLDQYDLELKHKTGCTLREIACMAASVSENKLSSASANLKVAAIPISSGQGIIPHFAQAVQAITHHIGFSSFTTDSYDIAGLAEAVNRKAQIIFLADDSSFVAVNLPHMLVVDNNEATARGYVAALESMARGIRNRQVLVIGAGKVGTQAIRTLKEWGARAGIFDINAEKAEMVAKEYGVTKEDDLEQALQHYSLLFDASPASEIIQAKHIKSDTMIAACGIPLGLTAQAYSLVKDRLIHDPLQIGVATMLAMTLR